MLRINPFDEPNVQQAKDATGALLNRYKSEGQLQVPAPDLVEKSGVTLTSSRAAQGTGDGADALLTLLRPGDYFALLAYLGPDEAIARELKSLRRAVRDRARVATFSRSTRPAGAPCTLVCPRPIPC